MWLLLNSIAFATTRHYGGRILGVSVRVALDDTGRSADVQLAGAPLLGRVTGTAHFDDDDQLVMDDELAGGLRRRGCSVLDVYEDELQKVLSVDVQIPIFGRLKILVARRG